MLSSEPEIKVALLQNYKEARLNLKGRFLFPDKRTMTGHIIVRVENGKVVLYDPYGMERASGKELMLSADDGAIFTVSNVKIGIDFHWQRSQQQSFHGNVILSVSSASSFNLINEIALEDYLVSVISSEMSPTAPLEFLKAQAIVARSWLVSMLERKKKDPGASRETPLDANEIIIWHDVNDHEGFDVCADDHCQRYQGITKVISYNVQNAIEATRGLFLVSGEEICDARYYKSCGGQTEIFSTAWEDKSPAYLMSVTDDVSMHPSVQTEKDAQEWLLGRPPAFCNTTDKKMLSKILPAFDQETIDFYRWQVIYPRQELEDLIRKKSGIDFGELKDIVAVGRGPSGRIYKLRIEGSRRTVVVGKELEIRRWLSPSHLLSSAFVVSKTSALDGSVESFTLNGGGWGHGVGLCQIGAAAIASRGYNVEAILAHYFTDVSLQKLY